MTTTSNRLRDFLRRRVDAAGVDALKSGQAPSDQVLTDLERLERLAALATSTGVRRWPAIVVMLVLLLALSAYFVPRLAQMDVDLDVTASELTVTLPTEQMMTHRLRALVLGVSGVRVAELPSESGPPSRYEAPAGAAGSIRLTAEGDPGGTIDLDELRLPAEASVRLSVTGPNRLTLVVRPAPRLSASVLGRIAVQVDGREPQRRLLPAPRAVTIDPAEREIALDLVLSEEPNLVLASHVRVGGLSFSHPDPTVGAGSTLLRRPSAILSGTLTLTEVGGREIRLHPAEGLRVDRTEGEIGTLAFREGALAVGFRGTVSGLRTGSEAHPRFLMPRRLEWLAANDAAGLAWTGILTLVGVVLGLIRWWRIPS